MLKKLIKAKIMTTAEKRHPALRRSIEKGFTLLAAEITGQNTAKKAIPSLLALKLASTHKTASWPAVVLWVSFLVLSENPPAEEDY
jgi:hypothetical protein